MFVSKHPGLQAELDRLAAQRQTMNQEEVGDAAPAV